MRRFALIALLALVAGPLALAQQQPPDPFLAERLLDPGALFFISLPRSAAVSEDYAKSNLRALAEHPEIRAFLEPFEAWFRRRRTQPFADQPPWNEMSRALTGLTLDEMSDLLQGPVSFAAYDVPASQEHTLDLVLTLGNADGTALQKAAEHVKEAIRNQGGAAEGTFQHGGATIYEFGSQHFRIFYTCIQGTIVFATRQNRIEKVIDAATNAAFAGLGTDPAFKAARDRVTPENRHFMFLHLNLAQVFKQFRREMGDTALKVMEALGVSDIASIAASMSYDGPFIRERYALLTTRQDRGIPKVLAGGTPKDPHAALVPAGVLSYSHFGLNLAELFDVILSATKADPNLERDFKNGIEEIEGRMGFKVRDALASVGSSWTAVTWLPEGGGILPDGIYLISLNDPTKFEETIEKTAAEAGLAVEEMSFRGQKIRYLSFGSEANGVADDLGLPGIVKFGFAIAWFHKDGTLYLSGTPLSLKRQILRFGRPGPSIAQDPKWAALAARVPEKDWESWSYTDAGRTMAMLYNLFEPFVHLVRDFARDPQTGEPVVDLARMPLGETLGDLMGATLTTKRTLPDGIFIESRSNTGVSVSSFGLVAVAAAAAIPALLMGARGGPGGDGLDQGEMAAEFNLKFIRDAQETFKNSDSDRNGQADYWTRDVAGLHALKDRSGQAIFLVDRETAQADPEGAGRYEIPVAPRNGYLFRALVTDPDGEAYAKDEDMDGQSTTNRARYGIVAWPARYAITGRSTFITSEAGRTWKKDCQGQPVDRWPGKDPAEDGWQPAD